MSCRRYGTALALLVLVAGESWAVVLCARSRPDGSLDSLVRIRAECRPFEVTLDPVTLGLQGPPGPPGEPGMCTCSTVTTTTVTTTTVGPSAGRPLQMPIAVGTCLFDAAERCVDIPAESLAPDGTTTFWTSLSDDPANAAALIAHLPSTCCGGGQCGGGEQGSIRVGDSIRVAAGQTSAVLAIIEDCVERDGLSGFLVPVVPCDATGASAPVVAFAVIGLSSVDTVGPQTGVHLWSACPASLP